ncbi:MAG: response regulator transcription factor [Xenococcus sp. (in: cyanobacteria)]
MKTIDINQKTVRVLIVDDQKSVRLTLKLYLESNSQIEVVAMAEDGVTALEKIAQLQPNVTLIDLEMPGMNGITTIEIINKRFPKTKTLVLSSHEQKEYIHQAILAGAKGYLKKGASQEQLTAAVLKVNQGYFQLDTELSEKFSLTNNGTLQEEYHAVDIDKIDFWPLETGFSDNSTENSHKELTQMRREIVDILEFKIHLLESKKNNIHLNFKRLQRQFSWLLASQLVLFFVVLGSTSSLLKIKQQSSNNMQSTNFVDTSQLVK